MAVYIGINPIQAAGLGPSNLSSMYFGTTKLWPSVQERSGSYVAMGQFTNYNYNYATPRIQFFENNLSASTGLKTGSGFDSVVFTGYMNTDNSFYAGGIFNNYDATSSRGIIKIASNGARVDGFNVGDGIGGSGGTTYVSAIMPTPEGQVYIGGVFNSWSGSSTFPNGTAISKVVRINSNGTLDGTFQPPTYNSPAGIPQCFATQSDGKIIVGQSAGRDYYTEDGTVNVGLIFRLNTNFTLDRTFYTGSGDLPFGEAGIFGNAVYDVKVLPDDKILVAGEFSRAFGDTTYKHVVRLNSDGTLDTSFSSSAALAASGYYKKIIVEPSGSAYSYYLGTNAFTYTYNGTTTRTGYMVRMFDNGSPDPTYGVPSGFVGGEPSWMEDLGNTILYGGQDWFSGSVNYGKIVKVDKYSSPMKALSPPLVGNGLDNIVRVALKFYS